MAEDKSQPWPDLEVSITMPYEVDWKAFSLWMNGKSLDDATRVRLQAEPPSTKAFPHYEKLMFSETRNYFRLFKSLEVYLHSPPTLYTQNPFRLPSSTCERLIVEYYSFDDTVVRELLGKKLNSRNRKDLDEVSEKAEVSLLSCRRQFDNIKRILKVVDDLDGSLVDNIREQFCLPHELSKKYAALVFISSNRFDATKRSAGGLLLHQFIFCAIEMIDHWTIGSADSMVRAVDDDLELDRDFLQSLHDLRVNLIDKVWIEKRQKAVMKDLRKKLPNAQYRMVDTNFRKISRSFVEHGADLIHTKDLKDFFVDLMENIIDPLKQCHLSPEQVDVLLDSLMNTFPEVEAVHRKASKRSQPWSPVYHRYMSVMKKCTIKLYS